MDDLRSLMGMSEMEDAVSVMIAKCRRRDVKLEHLLLTPQDFNTDSELTGFCELLACDSHWLKKGTAEPIPSWPDRHAYNGEFSPTKDLITRIRTRVSDV